MPFDGFICEVVQLSCLNRTHGYHDYSRKLLNNLLEQIKDSTRSF